MFAMFLTDFRSSVRGVIEYTLYVLIALFPFILYRSYLYTGTSSRAVTLMIVVEILAIILGVYLLSTKRAISFVKSPITIALGLYLIVLIISALQGIDPSISFWSKATRVTGIFYFTHLIVFYTFLVLLFKDQKVMRSFFKVFTISAGIFSIGSLLSREGYGLIGKATWDGFTFGNTTFAAMYLFAAFMIAIYYVFSQPDNQRRWWKYIMPFIILLNPIFINRDLLTGNFEAVGNIAGFAGEARASTYVAVFSVLILIVLKLISKIKSENIKRKIIWSAVTIIPTLLIIAVYSFFSPNGYVREVYMSQSTGARPVVWELSNKAINEKPLFGWGPENFEQMFQEHYDNRLLEDAYGNEPWFDRAHNVFIDQAVDIGYIGLLVYILLYVSVFGALVYILLKSTDKNDKLAASILSIYFLGHILELQTAFDTSISYPALAIMLAFSSVLFHKTYVGQKKQKEIVIPQGVQYGAGILLVGYFAWGFFAGTLPIMAAELANGTIRTVGNSEGRLQHYNALFGSPMDKASFLWRTSTDLQRGIAQDPSILEVPGRREGIIKEIDRYISEYKEYIEKHPADYRAHLNLADLLIYSNLFGVNRLSEAQAVLDKAVMINLEIPQAYWMKAVGYLYVKDFDNARLWAKKGYDLNPNIKESKKVSDYIESSIKTFPEVDLYFFRQI